MPIVLWVYAYNAGPGERLAVAYSARGSRGTKLGDGVWDTGKA